MYCLFNIGYVTQSRRTHNKRTKLCCLGTHEEDFYITAEYAISQAHKVHVRRNDIRFCSCISDACVNLEFQNYAWLKKEYATLDAAMRNHQPLKRHLGARLFLRFEPSINKIDIRVHNVPHAYEFNGESVTEPTNTGVHLTANEWDTFKLVMSTVETLRNDIKTQTVCYDKHHNQKSAAYCDYCGIFWNLSDFRY